MYKLYTKVLRSNKNNMFYYIKLKLSQKKTLKKQTGTSNMLQWILKLNKISFIKGYNKIELILEFSNLFTQE